MDFLSFLVLKPYFHTFAAIQNLYKTFNKIVDENICRSKLLSTKG